MFSLQIPLLGAAAGPDNDGVVVGSVNQSAPVAVLLGESLVTIAQVLRKDITATGTAWADLTTVALDAAAGDFQPFGVAASMSLGDSFYVRTLNDEDTHHFYVQVAPPGVGTWTLGLQEWNETADAWEAVAGLVDGSNGFRAAEGVYKIEYTSGAGGGGAGGAGGSSSGTGAAGIAGAGGNGLANDITGALTAYAGGGGGGIGGGQGAAGAGGAANSTTVGGMGGVSNGTGGSGAANTGSGGGGGGARAGEGLPSGAAGGSGVVIIRFATQTRGYQALGSYADDTAAKTAGLLVGQFYRDSTSSAVRQVVS